MIVVYINNLRAAEEVEVVNSMLNDKSTTVSRDRTHNNLNDHISGEPEH